MIHAGLRGRRIGHRKRPRATLSPQSQTPRVVARASWVVALSLARVSFVYASKRTTGRVRSSARERQRGRRGGAGTGIQPDLNDPYTSNEVCVKLFHNTTWSMPTHIADVIAWDAW